MSSLEERALGDSDDSDRFAWPRREFAVTDPRRVGTDRPERQAMTKRNPFAKDLPEIAQGAREQAASETEADLGTTSYTHVIRRPEPPETREDRYISAMWACDEDFMAAVREVMALADAENATLTAENDRLRACFIEDTVSWRDSRERQGLKAAIGQRDATITALVSGKPAARTYNGANPPKAGPNT